MKAKKKLRVTFPDGTVICYKDALFTVLEVLRTIGSKRFGEINLEVQGQRLVSSEKQHGYKSTYIKEVCDGWYYLNQSDACTKCYQLHSINEQLNLNLSIELGEGFIAKANPKTVRRSPIRRKLKVTMADGDVIDYDGPEEVFMTCIDKLGPRTLSAKANFDFHGSPLFTTTNTSGKRLKVADFLYVAIPDTAQEIYKILNMILLRLGLHKSMTIELLSCA